MESRLRTCRVVSVGILALGLVVALLAHPATGQVTLEDALARSFDVAVTIAPVDRNRGNGTLTGRARISLEITALSPISRLQMELNSRLTVKSVRAEETQVSFSRSGSGLTLSFGQPQVAGNHLTVTIEYEGQPSSIFNEYVSWQPIRARPSSSTAGCSTRFLTLSSKSSRSFPSAAGSAIPLCS